MVAWFLISHEDNSKDTLSEVTMNNKGVGITVLLVGFLSGVTSDGRYFICYFLWLVMIFTQKLMWSHLHWDIYLETFLAF